MSNTPAKRALAGESYIIPDAIWDDIDGSPTWRVAVSHLSDHLKLPDMGTRHGLKKVHARFNDIYRKLNSVYHTAQSQNNERVMGAVVGIMAKMCADAILRDKLFQRGILNKVLPLLEIDLTRNLALHALGRITHHGGLTARQEIARHNKTLVKLIQDHPDDPTVADFAIITMSHATQAVVAIETSPDPALVREISLKSVLETIVASLRKPVDSLTHLTHALELLTSVTQHCPRESKAVPGMLSLLAAFTRSRSLPVRALALTGLQRLPITECEFEQQVFDPNRLMSLMNRRTPAHLADILLNYGADRIETSVLIASSAEYLKAMMRALQDHDMYALGRKLYTLIQTTEFVVAEGGMQSEDGKLITEGLPFVRFTDALPLAAQALRARAGPGDLDAADVVEMKFYMIRSRLPEAVALGHAAVKRNPRLGYAYYVVSMAAETDQGLRAVKKGLKCPDLTPFVRNQMLWRAVGHAGEQGMRILHVLSADEDVSARTEGAAFLMSAWEDAKTFISEAPPDTRHMLTVLSWYVMLTVAIRGPELSEDLRELEPALRKIKTTMDFMDHFGFPIKRTQLHLWRGLLLEWYSPGAREWGPLVKRYDELDLDLFSKQHAPMSAAQADDNLAAWLGDMAVGDHHGHNDDGGHDACHPGRPRNHVPVDKGMGSFELYRCSWCGNPSAALKKCGGCGKAKYCDSGCQKLHWSDHKNDCKRK